MINHREYFHQAAAKWPVAVLDYTKCHPEKCDSGICAAVERRQNRESFWTGSIKTLRA